MSRGLIAAAAAQIEGFLLEPVEPPEAGASPVVDSASVPAAVPRPVLAVVGLGRRCGCTTVARALATDLAARDPEGAAAVASRPKGGGLPLAFPAAQRLAAVLADVPGATADAVGRLCLVEAGDRRTLAEAVRGVAPLVIDAGAGEIDSELVAIADLVLLIAAPGVEPALAAAVSSCVERLDGRASTVLNRFTAAVQPPCSAGVTLPESRMGAQLALAGRHARGRLGRAVGELADLCVGAG